MPTVPPGPRDPDCATDHPLPPTAFVVLAGGSGTRVGADRNKAFLPLGGLHVVSWSLVWAARVPGVRELLLVTRAADVSLAGEVLAADLPQTPVTVVTGGATRHGSERAALDHLAPRVVSGELELVAFHDAARPLALPSLVADVLTAAGAHGGAVPAVAAPGLLPVTSRGRPASHVLGGDLARMQTPQAFGARELLRAYDAAAAVGFTGTDTASTVEAFSDLPVRTVPGSALNIKITYPWDVPLAEYLLSRCAPAPTAPGRPPAARR